MFRSCRPLPRLLCTDGDGGIPSQVIVGTSNGALAVGACLTQRPDRYGACLVRVGVLDMLRFHKSTIGWAWTWGYRLTIERVFGIMG